MIFWYQSVQDADILVGKINEEEANNVILLLQMEYLNDVIEKVGGLPLLPIINNYTTIITPEISNLKACSAHAVIP